MNRRRALILASGAWVALAPLAAIAQRAQKLPVVAYVFGPVPTSQLTGPDPAHAHALAFVHRLRALGWEDGRNVILERHGAEDRPERAQAILADVVARKVDVIYAAATAGAKVLVAEAIRATRTIPIVFAGSSDPVAAGLVASLARPGDRKSVV